MLLSFVVVESGEMSVKTSCASSSTPGSKLLEPKGVFNSATRIRRFCRVVSAEASAHLEARSR